MDNGVPILLSTVSATINSLQRFKHQYDKELSFDFDPIRDIWGFQETKVSALLAYFLDPQQRHGQGRVFLDSFLTFLKNKDFDYPELFNEIPEVTTEYYTPANGRFDIFIEFKEAGIIIENKIWASDQYRQLSGYRDWLDAKRWAKKGYLIYLTPKGHEPAEDSLKREAGFKKMDCRTEQCEFVSWHDDMKLLVNSWIDLTRASVVRSVLELFKRAIENEIGGGFSMNEEKTIIEVIGKSRDSIKAAYAIAEAFPSFRKFLVDEYMKVLREIAKEKGFEFSNSPDLDVRYSSFIFSKLVWKNVVISFSFEGKGMNDFSCGICRKDKEFDLYKEFEEVKKYVFEKTGTKDQNKFWLCFEYSIGTYRAWNKWEVISELERKEHSNLTAYIVKQIDKLNDIAEKADGMFSS